MFFNGLCMQRQLNTDAAKTTVSRLIKSNSVGSRTYSINNTYLTDFDEVKNLGSLIDSNLCFKKHIDSIVSKTLQRRGIFFHFFC